MGGGLIAITVCTRLLFFPSSFFMHVVNFKERNLQWYMSKRSAVVRELRQKGDSLAMVAEMKKIGKV